MHRAGSSNGLERLLCKQEALGSNELNAPKFPARPYEEEKIYSDHKVGGF